MAKSIYLNSRSDLQATVKLMKRIREPEVILHIPKSSLMFSQPAALRALAKIAEELGKIVTIATVSAGGRRLALAAGFKVIKGRGKKERAPSMRSVVGDLVVQKKPTAKTLTGALPRLHQAVKQVLPQAPVKRSIRSLKRPKVLVAGAVVLVLVILAFFVLPAARIVVATRSETVTRDLEIQVIAAQREVDPAKLTIPGLVINREVEASKSFTPTGRRNIGKKASGFVQLYNLSKTTLESSGKKLSGSASFFPYRIARLISLLKTYPRSRFDG